VTLDTGLQGLRFDGRGLVPAIVQDAGDGTVLMLGYMNAEALDRTLSSGDVWFWSRSRAELWHKGETSGNFLRVVDVRLDCDGDTVLVRAVPEGPTCHTGARSCFSSTLPASNTHPADARDGGAVLAALFRTIEGRRRSPEPGSYTNHLLTQGVDRIARKLGEETAEVIVAAKNGDPAELAAEVADLLYHALVLLSAQGVSLDDVGRVLHQREGAPRRHKEPSPG
jgi:phosphoribosyl-ATP pyrophosphohydrolase/phosphoribosyl-AMP cyclohydrolase